MKGFYLAAALLLCIGLFSCNRDEGDIPALDEEMMEAPLKPLKRFDRYDNGLRYSRVINYDAQNRIESIELTQYHGAAAPRYNKISVDYTDDQISTILDETSRGINQPVNESITYTVFYENNKIRLLSQETGIDILHANGFIDEVLEYRVENSVVYRHTDLIRDSLQNLTSVSWNGGGVINRYSNFDSGKKPDQDGFVIDIAQRKYFILFGLKVSANNPRTSAQTIGNSTNPESRYTYEYDEEGYIIRTYNGDVNDRWYADTFYKEE